MISFIRAWFSRRAAHHRRALLVVGVTLVLVGADAELFSFAERVPYLHGLYVILANAETFGGDIGPTNTLGYIANVIVLLLLIPLVAAVWALLTSGFTEEHFSKVHERIDEVHKLARDTHAAVTSPQENNT